MADSTQAAQELRGKVVEILKKDNYVASRDQLVAKVFRSLHEGSAASQDGFAVYGKTDPEKAEYTHLVVIDPNGEAPSGRVISVHAMGMNIFRELEHPGVMQVSPEDFIEDIQHRTVIGYFTNVARSRNPHRPDGEDAAEAAGWAAVKGVTSAGSTERPGPG